MHFIDIIVGIRKALDDFTRDTAARFIGTIVLPEEWRNPYRMGAVQMTGASIDRDGVAHTFGYVTVFEKGCTGITLDPELKLHEYDVEGYGVAKVWTRVDTGEVYAVFPHDAPLDRQVQS